MIVLVDDGVKSVTILLNAQVRLEPLLADESDLVEMQGRDEAHLTVTLDIGDSLNIDSIVHI